jgi:ethanolamine utilization protein EutA (predicted chaperonin)
LPGRALDYLSFYQSVRRHLGAVARAGDIVVAKTDPPLLSVVIAGDGAATRSALG